MKKSIPAIYAARRVGRAHMAAGRGGIVCEGCTYLLVPMQEDGRHPV